jgi:hypothetical protein
MLHNVPKCRVNTNSTHTRTHTQRWDLFPNVCTRPWPSSISPESPPREGGQTAGNNHWVVTPTFPPSFSPHGHMVQVAPSCSASLTRNTNYYLCPLKILRSFRSYLPQCSSRWPPCKGLTRMAEAFETCFWSGLGSTSRCGLHNGNHRSWLGNQSSVGISHMSDISMLLRNNTGDNSTLLFLLWVSASCCACNNE